MKRFILRRIVTGILTVAIVFALNFVIIKAAPGDPITTLMGKENSSPEMRAALEEKYGLDKPLAVQFVSYLRTALTGDLGTSIIYDRPVTDMISEKLAATVLLGLVAAVIAAVAGTLMGILAARKEGGVYDMISSGASYTFNSMPAFWLGLMLIILFSSLLGWFPSYGYSDARADYEGLRHVADVMYHMFLPCLTLVLILIPQYFRIAKSSVIQVSNEDFITTFRACGMSEDRIFRKYVFRNAILPTVTIFGISMAYLLTGTIGILLLLFAVIAAPALAPENPYHFGDDSLFAVGEGGHVLGTNHLGQDIFSMIIYGVRTSLRVAVISALISGILGVLIGGIAGFMGGKVDLVVSEIINIFMMLPTFFLIMLIIALFGNSITNVMVVIGITTWPSNAKLMRAQALSLRERTFVKSAAAMGETKRQILFKYIIPNGVFPVISNTTMGMSNAILTEAGLSFLGLGDPSIISWGQMIYQGKEYITSAWWISTFAGIAVIITVLIFYLLGDGLNHVLDPKYAGRR